MGNQPDTNRYHYSLQLLLFVQGTSVSYLNSYLNFEIN